MGVWLARGSVQQKTGDVGVVVPFYFYLFFLYERYFHIAESANFYLFLGFMFFLGNTFLLIIYQRV